MHQINTKGVARIFFLGGRIIYSTVKFINIWYTKRSNLKYNIIISKLKSMHLKLKLEDKISQGKYEMMTKRSNLQRKKLISLRCQCTKYTKEHSVLIYLFIYFFKFLVTIQCTFGCKEDNALLFCMFIKRKDMRRLGIC